MRLVKYLIAAFIIYHFKFYELDTIKSIFGNKVLQQKIFISILVYIFLDFVIIKRWQNMLYFRTHTHELTHSIAAMLTNKKVHQLAANEKDGHVLFSGNESWFVTLTPYFLPIYTIMLLPFRFLMQKGYLYWYDILIFFVYAFHVHTFANDFSYKQPDIKKNGYLLSTIYILIGNLFFITIISFLVLKKV